MSERVVAVVVGIVHRGRRSLAATVGTHDVDVSDACDCLQTLECINLADAGLDGVLRGNQLQIGGEFNFDMTKKVGKNITSSREISNYWNITCFLENK